MKITNNCYACSACKYICPQKAIEIVADERGFLHPQIDESKCTNCGLCEKRCKERYFNEDSECYAVINRSDAELMTSASGAVFPELAKHTFEQGGVVCGVAYDKNMKVCHMFAESFEEAKKFKSSKYVRSDNSEVYLRIKEYLNNGRQVLFVGTPCQVNGVKMFLGKDYDNLILCDLICHSNPTPKAFEKYIEYLEKEHGKKIIDFNFRDKSVAWAGSNCKATFDDGTEKRVDNIYSTAFLAGAISHEACYSCEYAGMERVGDITIGDFWGVDTMYPEFYDSKGVSVVLLNSEKGKTFFECIKDKFKFQKIQREEVFRVNHHEPTKKHKSYDKLLNKIDSDDFISFMKKTFKVNFARKVVNKLRYELSKVRKKLKM